MRCILSLTGPRRFPRLPKGALVLYMYSMLALRLPPDLERRLDELARKTGRTKSFYAREAIVEHIEDLEDYYLAESRIRTESGERIALEDVMAEFADDLQADPVARRIRPARTKGPARPRKH